MAGTSKNARTSSATQSFFCPKGAEIAVKTIVEGGKRKTIAECGACGRRERRPRDFSDCRAESEES